MSFTETFKEFVIKLGYAVDEESQRRMSEAVHSMGENVRKLGEIVHGAAAGIVLGVAVIAEKMDDLYWASQRTKSTVDEMEALAYGIAQAGGSAAKAKQSMEGFAEFLRSSPGAPAYAENMLGHFNGAAQGLEKLGELARKLADEGQYPLAKAIADTFHVDENTLQALMRDYGEAAKAHREMAKAMGVDEDKLAKDSVFFMHKLNAAYLAFEILTKKIVGRLQVGLGIGIDTFTKYIIKNVDVISSVINTIAHIILFTSDLLLHWGEALANSVREVIEWFGKLDPAAKQAIETVGLLVAGWMALNSAFLRSPLGMMVLLVLALGALIEDYESWKKDANSSLIDWSKWEPGITMAAQGIRDLVAWFKEFNTNHHDFVAAAEKLAIAWALLNNAFVKSPIGRLFLFGAALIYAYESYAKWVADGRSADSPWARWAPIIENLLKALSRLAEDIDKGVKAIGDWETVLDVFLAYMGGRFLLGLAASITSSVGHFSRLGAGIEGSVGKGSMAMRALGGLHAMLGKLALAGFAFGLWYEFLGPGRFNDPAYAQKWGEDFAAHRQAEEEAADKSPSGRLKRWWGRTMPTWLGGDTPIDASVTPEGGALLNTIALPESGGRYDALYGGQTFTGYAEHPNIRQRIMSGPNEGQYSTAAGKYQFNKETWDEVSGILGLKDFSPASQDKAAWFLAQREYKQRTGRDLQADLKDPAMRGNILPALRNRWTSMPGGKEENSMTSSLNGVLSKNLSELPMKLTTPSAPLAPNLGINSAMAATPPPSNENNVTMHQTNHINVETGSPEQAGRELQSALNRTNADALRQVKERFR